MIIKSYEVNKIDFNQNKLILLYGKNEGFKNEATNKLIESKELVTRYEEKEILENTNYFIENLLTGSLFDDEKIIIIRRTTDKIIKFIDEIVSKNIEDIKIIFNSDNLEKKSKLRSLFEKDKQLVCIPFYKETEQSLVNLTISFCKDKKINISRHLINLIIKRSMNDRLNLKNELNKIEAYSLGGKEINEQNILKLTNQSENYSISTLIDNCLTKNEKKIKEILNENNFSGEECIQIIRTFLMKSKRLLVLSTEVENTKSIDTAIATSKPPIFWKDKEIVKKQLTIWTTEKITKLIKRINLAELLIKKNSANSINILLDFIFKETSKNINNFS